MVPEFPQDDLDACQGKEALVGFDQPIVPNLDASFKAEPSVRPFNSLSYRFGARAEAQSRTEIELPAAPAVSPAPITVLPPGPSTAPVAAPIAVSTPAAAPVAASTSTAASPPAKP